MKYGTSSPVSELFTVSSLTASSKDIVLKVFSPMYTDIQKPVSRESMWISLFVPELPRNISG